MDVKAKIAELGLTIPTAALPVAAYIPTVKTGNLVFTAGQLPLLDGKIPHVGKVGGEVSEADAKAGDGRTDRRARARRRSMACATAWKTASMSTCTCPHPRPRTRR